MSRETAGGDPLGKTPAASLAGMELAGGWLVGELLQKAPGQSGGTFSESYAVGNSDGRKAFLKAFDYSLALSSPNTAESLLKLTGAYVFERDLLLECASSRMSRVVLALDAGEIDVPGFGLLSRVNYLVFEPAERDARRHRDLMAQIDVAWALRSLHQVATGLSQLHGKGVAHQDLKPSNVLVFDDQSSKVGDLGRANWSGHQSPYDNLPIAGDWNYAPPELHYGFVLSDELTRRRACDLYHLGSVVLFMFAGVGTTGALAAELDPSFQWGNWTLGYHDVLPYLIDAFDRVASRLQGEAPVQFADRVVAVFRELCNPDVELRGDTKAPPGTRQRLSLVRFVTRFDLLAREAELGIRKTL